MQTYVLRKPMKELKIHINAFVDSQRLKSLCGRSNVEGYCVVEHVILGGTILDKPRLCKTCKRMYLDNNEPPNI